MKIFELIYRIKKKIIAFYEKYFTVKGLYDCILPDKIYVKKLYKARTGKELNLKNPQTFNEKQNWLKLYDRRPEYTMMVDKYKVREYIAEKIGEKYLVPLLGVWDSPDEIDFESLPNEFVLKCNHDNGVIICRDKASFDIDGAKKNLECRLNRDYYRKLREWPYKNVERKIICEKFMKNTSDDPLLDYKLFCFNGRVLLTEINSDRFTDVPKEDHYDFYWQHIDVTGKPSKGDIYPKPDCFEEMKGIAEVLSKNIPFVRIDFNIWNKKLYLGEITFYYGGAMHLFNENWENELGKWIHLDFRR